MYIKKKYINVSKPVDYEGWQRFEVLAEENPHLWEIFWCLSKDKSIIKETERCGVDYFEEALMPNLYRVMKEMWLNDKLDFEDLEIIMSLFVQMIPKDRCKDCDCRKKNFMEYDDFREDR